MSDDLTSLATHVLKAFRQKGWKVATAESCTGGLIAGALTEIAGSSDVVDRGFVTYSNEAKADLLGLELDRLYGPPGAVSEETVRAMAEGALAQSRADAAIAVTGIAGPGGGSPDKPVGLVWFGLSVKSSATLAHHEVFPGDRSEVREATVRHALELLLEAAGN